MKISPFQQVIYYSVTAVIWVLAVLMVENIDNLNAFGVLMAWYFGLLILRFAEDFFVNRLLIRVIFEQKYSRIFRLLETVEDSDKLIITLDNSGFVFRRSIDDNIRYGNLQASDEEINLAKETVLITEKKHLSLSDRQKIALARALTAKPEKLIMDNALDGCDELTVKQIKENVAKNYPEIEIEGVHHG
jgi:hypothetical protein